MTAGDSFRSHLARRCPAAVLVAACLLAPTGAGAAPLGDGHLSPRLAALASPSLRSQSPAEQAERLSLAAAGPGSLMRSGGRVLVDVRFESGAAAGVAALRHAGARIVHVSRRYQTVTVAVSPAALPAIGAVARVRGVIEDLAPVVRATCPAGSVVSEGDVQLDAANARAAFGIDGSGVKVGILSDSFDQDPEAVTHAGADVASADLPGAGNLCGQTTPVGILENFVPEEAGEIPGDEGRGMAQIVHDLAPGAAIDFATAFNGELDFADNIRALRDAGAKVIVDDVGYFDEPFFQDGPVAVAVNEVAAAGVDYFSAAGNDNLFDAATGKKGIASWEAPSYRDTGCPAGVPVYATHCMNFKPSGGPDSGFGITVEAGDALTVDLQWAQPWNGVTTDFDAYLLSGGTVVASSEYPSTDPSIQEPFELLSWENPDPNNEKTVELVIARCNGACGVARALANPTELAGTGGGDEKAPRLKLALLQNGGGVSATEYPESAGGDVVGPTVYGHSGAAGAIGVGAVPYGDSAQAERYSSRGPVSHYFGPVLGATPAKAIVPTVLAKPDLAATDCGVTTFFARQDKLGAWRFCGTSAAAPHAAAVAALVRQANPGVTTAQVRAELSATARPVGALGTNDVGAGLVDAYAAVRALALPPTIAITKAPVALSRNRRPTIEFSANRPVAFSCAVDGGAPQPCASPFASPAALADGRHGFAVSGVDLAGRSGSSGVVSFTIDTKAPRTSIAKHPRKLIRTHRRRVREVFRFRASEPGVKFVCKVDRGLLRFCGSRIVHRFDAGKHTVLVKAQDEAGNVDRSPAVFRFRVERVGSGK